MVVLSVLPDTQNLLFYFSFNNCVSFNVGLHKNVLTVLFKDSKDRCDAN